MGVPFHLLKENIVDLVVLTRARRPVGVLLGGSGLALPLSVCAPKLSALLKPLSPAEQPMRDAVVELAGNCQPFFLPQEAPGDLALLDLAADEWVEAVARM